MFQDSLKRCDSLVQIMKGAQYAWGY